MSYGVPMVYNDSLSSALSNGENRISSFLLVTSIHGSVRFGACMHKRWEQWLKTTSFPMVWSQTEELGRVNSTQRLTFTSSIQWWKPHLFISSGSFRHYYLFILCSFHSWLYDDYARVLFNYWRQWIISRIERSERYKSLSWIERRWMKGACTA